MEGNDAGFAEFFTQSEGNDQHQVQVPGPPQGQYEEIWSSEPLVGHASFSSQVWTEQCNPSALSPHAHRAYVDHYLTDPQGLVLDLSDIAPNLDYVNNRPVETLIKPAGEGPRLPGYPLHGYHGTYLSDEAPSALESDQGSTFDSAYYSENAIGCAKIKQEPSAENRSEHSTVSGAQISPIVPRHQAGSAFGENRSTVSGSGRKRKRSTSTLPVCEHCNDFWPKNRSDATKHERKHTKPFKCEFPECQAKNVGFSTENDRDRHYKSGRHNLAPVKGAKKGYVCAACVISPGGKPKWWPRQDNFKAHCSRKHNELDLEDLIRSSERDTKPMETYIDDNTTLLSDAGYQQQSFSVQQDPTNGYDMGHAAAFGQGQDNQTVPYDTDQFLMGMTLSSQPLVSPESHTWTKDNDFLLPTGPFGMETSVDEARYGGSPHEIIPANNIRRYQDYEARTGLESGLYIQQKGQIGRKSAPGFCRRSSKTTRRLI